MPAPGEEGFRGVIGQTLGLRTEAIKANETRGRGRAGPSFQLGTLSTRIANLFCVTLVKAMTSVFPTRWFSSSSRKPAR